MNNCINKCHGCNSRECASIMTHRAQLSLCPTSLLLVNCKFPSSLLSLFLKNHSRRCSFSLLSLDWDVEGVLLHFLLIFPWNTFKLHSGWVYWVMSNIWKIRDYLYSNTHTHTHTETRLISPSVYSGFSCYLKSRMAVNSSNGI